MSTTSRRISRVSAEHQELAADVLHITDRLVAVNRHVDELRDLQARAVALAADSGVPQRVLAKIVGVSAPRISQIVRSQPVDIDRRQLHEDWTHHQQWPGDRLDLLTGTPDDLQRAAQFQTYASERDQPAVGGRNRPPE